MPGINNPHREHESRQHMSTVRQTGKINKLFSEFFWGVRRPRRHLCTKGQASVGWAADGNAVKKVGSLTKVLINAHFSRARSSPGLESKKSWPGNDQNPRSVRHVDCRFFFCFFFLIQESLNLPKPVPVTPCDSGKCARLRALSA